MIINSMLQMGAEQHPHVRAEAALDPLHERSASLASTEACQCKGGAILEQGRGRVVLLGTWVCGGRTGWQTKDSDIRPNPRPI